MKSSIIFFMALISAAASEKNLSRPISLFEISDRIADGQPADVGQFPYLVGLEYTHPGNIKYLCTGSLIGVSWVLTVAHCTEGADSVRVILGVVDRNEPDLSILVSNNNFIQHERFQWATWLHDIALIRIPYVTYTDNIKRIKLPSIEPPYPSDCGKRVTVAGWGVQDDTAEFYSYILYHTEMTVICNEECSNLHYNIFESNICAAPFGGGNVCHGDEGAPMVLKDSQVLIGINSRVTHKFEKDPPTVFTRVTSYLDWIAEKTGIEY